MAFIIPLTTQIKYNPYYIMLTFKGKKQAAMISQLRVIDTGRFYQKIGVLDENNFFNVIKCIKKLFPRKS